MFARAFCRFISVLLLSVFFCTALLCAACGAFESGARAPSRPRPPANPVPSMQNFADWNSTWDGASWILALDAESHLSSSGTKEQLRGAILTALEREFSQRLSIPQSALQPMLGEIGANLGAEIVSLPQNNLLIDNDKLGGFAVVRFSQAGEKAWVRALGGSSVTPSELLTSAASKAALQWRVLGQTSGIKWAEPNLQSELSDLSTNNNASTLPYSLAPEVGNNLAPFAQVLRLVRADVAWQLERTAGNVPRYEFNQHDDLSWTNVAIIDTGVDYLHPDLFDSDPNKSHIFQNPREAADCIDNDGNGFIDDIYGIDATMEREEWNARMLQICKQGARNQPVPGPADIGGPGQACPEADFDLLEARKCGHGTHVAGIVAAKPGGQTATIGICPKCRIVSLRVAREEIVKGVRVDSTIDDASQVRAFTYLLNLVDEQGQPYVRVANLSLGKYFSSRSLSFLVRRLFAKDILVVAAAGNEDTDAPNFPAAYEPVLAVCATSDAGSASASRSSSALAGITNPYAKASFSNFGTWVDICAPGVNICSTIPGITDSSCNENMTKMGTSQASPLVAGAAAFIKSLYPAMGAAEIANLLKKYSNATQLYYGATSQNTANQLYQGWFPDGTEYYLLGSGFLDLASALSHGKACWDPANLANCLSFVAEQQGGSSVASGEGRVTEGCVASSVAGKTMPMSAVSSALPFLFLQLWLLLVLGRRLQARSGGGGIFRRTFWSIQ